MRLDSFLVVDLEKGEIRLEDEFLFDAKLVQKFRPSRVSAWITVLARLVTGERIPYWELRQICGELREYKVWQFLEKVNKQYGTTFCLVRLYVEGKRFGHRAALETLGLANRVYKRPGESKRKI